MIVFVLTHPTDLYIALRWLHKRGVRIRSALDVLCCDQQLIPDIFWTNFRRNHTWHHLVECFGDEKTTPFAKRFELR